MVELLLLVALVWGRYAEAVNAPCRGLSELACVESQRSVSGELVAPGAVFAPSGQPLELHPWVARSRPADVRRIDSAALWGEP